MKQTALLCGCGARVRRGRCTRCRRRARLNHERFNGNRERVLARDENRCRVCGRLTNLVHHRRPGTSEERWLITLCRRCHLRAHRLRRLGYGAPELLRRLWRELRPRIALQREFEFLSTREPKQGGFFDE